MESYPYLLVEALELNPDDLPLIYCTTSCFHLRRVIVVICESPTNLEVEAGFLLRYYGNTLATRYLSELIRMSYSTIREENMSLIRRKFMNTKSLEECKQVLLKGDSDTLERRAIRLQELEQIQTDGRLFSSQREWDYASEASDSYINGNYRSAVFCCACAIDQIFRYEYVKVPGNKYEDVESGPFGRVISKCKKENVKSLIPFMEQAELLRDMRNEVAAHPLFIDLPTETDPERHARNALLLKDIKKLLDLVGRIDTELRKKIESTELINEVEGEKCVFGKVIDKEDEILFNLDGFWGLIELDILKFLASQAWGIMKEIAEGLYGVSS